MRSRRPAVMTNRALWLAASLVTPACAANGAHVASTIPASTQDEARIAELESRIAFLEGELEAARANASRPAAIRIPRSEATESEDPVAAALVARGGDGDADAPDRDRGEPVVLRLYEERAPAPLPVITERLAVAPMPTQPPLPSPSVAPAPFPPVATASSVPTVATNATPPLAAILPSAATAPATIAAVPPAMNATIVTPTEDTNEYRLGLGHLTARRYEAAVASLSSFLRDHPGSPRAGDAMYWRATANYALRRYGDALIDYERVPRIAPRGEHAADAIYHAGLCHRRMGADARARSSFERVRREYPESAAARLAAREEST